MLGPCRAFASLLHWCFLLLTLSSRCRTLLALKRVLLEGTTVSVRAVRS